MGGGGGSSTRLLPASAVTPLITVVDVLGLDRRRFGNLVTWRTAGFGFHKLVLLGQVVVLHFDRRRRLFGAVLHGLEVQGGEAVAPGERRVRPVVLFEDHSWFVVGRLGSVVPGSNKNCRLRYGEI